MTIDLPRESAFNAPSKAVYRRQLLKAGVWAAPVLVLTTASPAMAASGPVPIAQLTVLSNALTNTGAAGVFGPLSWAGGSITWSRSTPGEPTSARVIYTAILSGPNGFSKTLVDATTTTLNNGVPLSIPSVADTTTGLAPGLYTVTLTATSGTGPNTSTSAQSSLALVTSDATVVAATGNKHDVTLTLTGAPGTEVSITTTPTDVALASVFPTTATIPSTGPYTVTRRANATGKTPGSIKFVFGGTNVVVSPAEITKPIPV